MDIDGGRWIALKALLGAALAALCAFGATAEGTDVVRVKGYVTFADRERLVIASDAKSHSTGRLVRLLHDDGTRAAGPTQFDEGERVIVTGVWQGTGKTRELIAGSIAMNGGTDLDEPQAPKAYDLRRGYLHLRRVRLAGRLGSVNTATFRSSDSNRAAEWRSEVSCSMCSTATASRSARKSKSPARQTSAFSHRLLSTCLRSPQSCS